MRSLPLGSRTATIAARPRRRRRSLDGGERVEARGGHRELRLGVARHGAVERGAVERARGRLGRETHERPRRPSRARRRASVCPTKSAVSVSDRAIGRARRPRRPGAIDRARERLAHRHGARGARARLHGAVRSTTNLPPRTRPIATRARDTSTISSPPSPSTSPHATASTSPSSCRARCTLACSSTSGARNARTSASIFAVDEGVPRRRRQRVADAVPRVGHRRIHVDRRAQVALGDLASARRPARSRAPRSPAPSRAARSGGARERPRPSLPATSAAMRSASSSPRGAG